MFDRRLFRLGIEVTFEKVSELFGQFLTSHLSTPC